MSSAKVLQEDLPSTDTSTSGQSKIWKPFPNRATHTNGNKKAELNECGLGDFFPSQMKSKHWVGQSEALKSMTLDHSS